MAISRTIYRIAVFVPIACCFVQAQATKAPTPAASCRQFVKEFYDWYIPTAERWLKNPPRGGGRVSDVALKDKADAFDPELARQLAEDSAAQKRTPHELVSLDFDPFLNAQDVYPHYSLGRVKLDGDRCRLNVYGYWETRDKCDEPSVTPEAALVNGRWVFVNFHYGKSDLLSELKRVRVLREKRHK